MQSAVKQDNLLHRIPYGSLEILGEPIGRGNYADVYEARLNGREVAVKYLHRNFNKELMHEADIMARCKHSNILGIYGVCREVGHSVLVLEYMSKGSLYAVLQNKKEQLSLPIRETIALDIVNGLNYLHKKNILHCDLKSSNILLTSSYFAKICDFGTSRNEGIKSNKLGSIRWLAPEVVKENELTKSSDIYSCGMVLWEIYSQEIPFKNENNDLIVLKWIADKKKEEIPSYCPKEIKDIIEICWLDNAKERPTASKIVKILMKKGQDNPSFANEEVDNLFPILLPNHASYGELGKWYLTYKNAAWCNRYHMDCLKEMGCNKWDRRFETFLLRGERISGSAIAHMDASSGCIFGTDTLYVPSLEVHNKVVKLIQESLIKIGPF
jgi:serine/threonine protein kinase